MIFINAGDYITSYRGYGIYCHSSGWYDDINGTDGSVQSGATLEIRPAFDNTTWRGLNSTKAHIDEYLGPQYYDCVGGVCTAVSHVTQFMNDPTCNNSCVVPPKYYDCVNGTCTEVSYVTSYVNDPTCNGACASPTPPSSILLPLLALVGAYLLYNAMKNKGKRT